MLNALSSVRQEWSNPVRLGLIAGAVALGCALAWFGAGLPVEVLLVAVAAIAAAILGFPAGIAVAVVSAVVLHYARIDLRIGDPVTGPFFLLVSGVAASVLFLGTAGSIETLGGAGTPERRALASGDSGGTAAEALHRSGLAALTAGVREISHGDFTKHVESSDASLRELAVALNEMLFTIRDFLTDLGRSANQLGSAGAELTRLASGAASATGQARSKSDRIAAELRDGLDAVEKALADSPPPLRDVHPQRAPSRIPAHVETSAARVLDASDALSAATLQTAQSATLGSTVAEATVEEARALELAVAGLNADLGRLSEIAAEIEAATRSLNRIGERTNFIFLNASIEAARSGREAGAFVAVADEVRTLAETSVRTNRDIARASERAQQIVSGAVSAAARLSQRATDVAANAGSAKDTMREVAASADAAQQRVAEIGITARVLRAACAGGALPAPVPEPPAIEAAPGAASRAASDVAGLATSVNRAFESLSVTNAGLAESAHLLLESGRNIEEIAGYIGGLVARFTVDAARVGSGDYRSARASANETDSVAPSRDTISAPPVSSEIAEHSNAAPPPSL